MSGLLSTVRAQATAVETLRRALSTGRVHHAYLFDGPAGVGKERAAFGLAQALVCERRVDGQPDACGACSACSRAVPRTGAATPLHPDVVVLERGLYEPAAIGRRTPEVQDLSIDQVRTLVLARAAFAPHEGRAKVFVVRRAGELSTGAANALLKVLEEPGARTHFVLLTSAPDALLATIRSRAARVRFGSLPDAAVAQLLVEGGANAAQAGATAGLAGGSMELATALSDPEASAERVRFTSRATEALSSNTTGGVFDIAEDAKKISKDVLVVQIQAFAGALRDRACAALAGGGNEAQVAAARYGLALAAVGQIEANASVQLTVESMLLRMRALI